jgi:hypothetical protein
VVAGRTLHSVRSWAIRIGLALTAPLWVPFVVAALVTEVAFLPGELRVRQQMRRVGRQVRWRELRPNLRGRAGTLIVEYPTPGWRFSRAWWTTEVLPEPPETAPDPDCPWLGAAGVAYHPLHTHLGDGTARLVAVWCGRWVVGLLRWRYPGLRVVTYCSFMAGEPRPNQAMPQSPPA